MMLVAALAAAPQGPPATGQLKPADLTFVELSYRLERSYCGGCFEYDIRIRGTGWADVTIRSGATSQVRLLLTHGQFRELVQAFHDARFFEIPRLGSMGIDVDTITVAYRDEVRTHEVVDLGRSSSLPALSQLETHIRDLVRVERYAAPSLALYQELAASRRWTPDGQALAAAAAVGDIASVRYLLDKGARVSEIPLFAAAGCTSGPGHPEILKLFLDRTRLHRDSDLAVRTFVCAAGNYRSTDVVALRLLLSRGVDPNGADPTSGETPLHRAVQNDAASAVRFLLAHRASVDAPGHRSRTPLMVAAEGCRGQIVPLLLTAGAKIGLRDDDGKTALDLLPTQCSSLREMLRAGR